MQPHFKVATGAKKCQASTNKYILFYLQLEQMAYISSKEFKFKLKIKLKS